MSVRKILQPEKNCWTVSKVTESGLLVDGRDYYRAFYHAARNAEEYILISGWQFDRTSRYSAVAMQTLLDIRRNSSHF